MPQPTPHHQDECQAVIAAPEGEDDLQPGFVANSGVDVSPNQSARRSPIWATWWAQRRWPHLGRAAWAGLVVFGTLLGVVTGLLDVWSVFDEESDDSAEPSMRATLMAVQPTQRQITLRDFLVEYLNIAADSSDVAIRSALVAEQIEADVSAEQLSTIGVVISYSVTFEGLNGVDCPFKWTLYDAGTRSPVRESYLVNQPAFPHYKLTPKARIDAINDQIWIPLPPRAGPFYVQLELFNSEQVTTRTRVGWADSLEFG